MATYDDYMPRRASKASEPLEQSDIRSLVKHHLPAWVKACNADAETVALHVDAFGTTTRELVLLACAIKYAAHAGKAVYVMWGNDASRSVEIQTSIVTTFQERTTRAPRKGKQKPQP